MKRERPCEAPVHIEDCECQRCTHYGVGCEGCALTTTDHFTPKSIARHALNWGSARTSERDNLQILSISCHHEKDRTTGRRFNAVMAQQRGGNITLEDVRKWADESEYNR